MSIASRIQSIEEHIKESYQELEGIGIDTTEVNKNLENIPKLIDGYWETLPKVTGEGTSITLDNTKEGKMKINLKGNTSQEGTPTPEAPQDIHVVSGDNTITVSNSDNTQSQSYPINLGDIELCKIGDYQDSIVKDNGKWYLNKQIGKVVLNGSESYSIHSITTGNIFRYAIGNVYIANNPIFTNYFKGVSNSSQRVLNSAYLREDNNYSLDILTDIYNTITDFKTWLSTHNTKAYYVLATPTTTEITDTTLQQQLNALEKAKSYNSQTNLTQTNDDKPFILDVTALKQLTQ